MTTPDVAGTRAAHLFVTDMEAPQLDDHDRHHVMTVLRLRPGEGLTVSDGDGRWRACRLGPGATIEPDGEVFAVDPLRPCLTVGIALTKGHRPELAVQKLTELGIDRILPFVGARSIVRWEGERARSHLRRLRRVAREASMQCGRVRLPAVEDVVSFPTAATGPGVAMAHIGGRPPTLAHPSVLVGPEGGWADEELTFGLPRISLGPSVLRAETAAIAVGALLAGLRLGLVAPVVKGTAQRDL